MTDHWEYRDIAVHAQYGEQLSPRAELGRLTSIVPGIPHVHTRTDPDAPLTHHEQAWP